MALAVGEILQKRYRIDAEMEQGGMANIYRAWDARLDIPVAVKEMLPQPGLGPQALADLRRQFKREARILARLDHPNLVRVLDSFSQDDSEYLVMNFVEGESLGERVDRAGAAPEAQVLAWADQLLSALAYCHSQGVIHRDVKSHNVIIRSDGQAVLVDFGLVKLWDPVDPYTKTVMRGLGTPAFAPPEQFELDAKHTDERCDIFSLGATLYHALTGELPPTSALRTANPEQIVSLRSIMPGVSQQTETVVMKAMELARSKRWQSADEMAKAFGGKSRRERVPIWVGALSIPALLLVAIGLAIVLGGKGERSIPTPSPEKVAGLSTPTLLTEASTATSLLVDVSIPKQSPTPAVTATPDSTDTPSPVPTPTDTATLSPTPVNSPTPTGTPAPTPTPVIHIVKEGENPTTVAQLYGVTVEALLAANGITDSATLQIGQALIIPQEEEARVTPTFTPTPFVHIVKAGENLSKIAQLYGISIGELLAANGITESTTLQVGQELIIPRRGKVPTATFTPAPTSRPTIVLPQLYEEPKLLEPGPNQVFGFNQQQIINLEWFLGESLAGSHWYEVQLRQAEDEGPIERYWTQENWWELGPEHYRPGDYYWRVVIVQGRDEDVLGTVSPPSEMRHFQWLLEAPKPTPGSKPTDTPKPNPTNTSQPTDTPEPGPTERPTVSA